ncbi:hypothetical protein D3C72_2338590 [compost metagenome]
MAEEEGDRIAVNLTGRDVEHLHDPVQREPARALAKMTEAQQHRTRATRLDLADSDDPLRHIPCGVFVDKMEDDRHRLRPVAGDRHLGAVLGVGG